MGRKDPPEMVSSHLLVCPSSPKSLVTAALVLLGVSMDVWAVAACSSEVFGCSKMSFPWKTLSSCRAAMTDAGARATSLLLIVSVNLCLHL